METKQQVEDSPTAAFIKVSENGENGIISDISCAYAVYVTEKKENDRYFNYFIPAFNIHYFAETEEDGKIIGEAGVAGFFDYWIKNQGKKAFYEQIEKLGFVQDKSTLKSNKEVRSNIKSKPEFRFQRLKPNVPPAYNHKAFDLEKTFEKTAA